MNRKEANETQSYYEGRRLEDKKLFIENLGWLLSQTREEVVGCEYITIDNNEFVRITYNNGYHKDVNINMDSYTAIVMDVSKKVN